MKIMVAGGRSLRTRDYDESSQVSTAHRVFDSHGGRFDSDRRCSTYLPRHGLRDDLPNRRQCVDQGATVDSGTPGKPTHGSVGGPT